ncbi:hypothetical protein KAJ38_02790 [Candidatus Pacearchaeota archaeon]|nr:hypothetical protein [Candidatus Pacearchaeota archaeon]
MSRKLYLFAGLLVISMMFFISAQDSPSVAVGGEDVEDIQGAIDDYSPLDDSGEVNLSKYKPFKSKAEERIEKINEYIGPITKVLWGVELSLSWIFIFSFIVWILLIELIVMPVSEILDFNIFGSLFAATIIASLSMQGFGKDFVIWMNSLMTHWWIGLIVLGGSVIVGFVYSVFVKTIGEKIKAEKEAEEKEKTDRARKASQAIGEIDMKRLKG